MNVSSVFAIQTQGRYHNGTLDRWPQTYRVAYSQDCSTFTNLLDVNGNNQVPSLLIVLQRVISIESLTFYILTIVLSPADGRRLLKSACLSVCLLHLLAVLLRVYNLCFL